MGRPVRGSAGVWAFLRRKEFYIMDEEKAGKGEE